MGHDWHSSNSDLLSTLDNLERIPAFVSIYHCLVLDLLTFKKRNNCVPRLCSGSGLEGVNQSDSEGTSPLHWTVKMGHLLATRALLNAPTIDVNATNEDGKTALMFAAEKGRVAILKELLLTAPGLHLDMVTLAGKTAEDLARGNNQREVLLILMGSRESLEVQTNFKMVETLERLSVGEGRTVPCCLLCTRPMVRHCQLL